MVYLLNKWVFQFVGKCEPAQSGGPSGRSRGQQGATRPPDRSLAAKSQTSLRMATVSEVGVFCDAGAKRAVLTADAAVLPVRSIAGCRSWPDEVSRPIAGLVGRSFATFFLFPRAHGCLCRSRQFATVGTNGTEMQVRAALATAEIEVKWSRAVAKLASQSRARAEPCRYLVRREPRWRSEHKCRLGEATWKMLKSKKANRMCNDGSPFVVI